MHGIAYTKDYDEQLRLRKMRHDVLAESGNITITKRWPEYGRNCFEGVCKDVTEDDICVYCDVCVPFGGYAQINGDEFRCVIFND